MKFLKPLIVLFLLSTAGLSVDAQTRADIQLATFAGGCFWCMEPPFDKLDGVLSTISGYTGGHTVNPSYKQVSSGKTGHIEVVQIKYDANKIGFSDLLKVYWKNIDPTRSDGQFCDKGEQYRPAIFYHDQEQKNLALESKQMLMDNKPFPDMLKVEIIRAATFYPAEEYHQDYYLKNPIRYRYYRYSCGRDKRLEEVWGAHST